MTVPVVTFSMVMTPWKVKLTELVTSKLSFISWKIIFVSLSGGGTNVVARVVVGAGVVVGLGGLSKPRTA